MYYAYQVNGPFDLNEGHRFDPDKILLDPYAHAIYFLPNFSRHAAIAPGPNAGKAPLGMIRTDLAPFDWRGDRKSLHTHDVVYNHTGEGNEHGPTYSFRGIDNTTYCLLADDRRHYWDDARTGNVLHTANCYASPLNPSCETQVNTSDAGIANRPGLTSPHQ